MKAGKQSGGATDEDDALKDTETPLMRKLSAWSSSHQKRNNKNV